MTKLLFELKRCAYKKMNGASFVTKNPIRREYEWFMAIYKDKLIYLNI